MRLRLAVATPLVMLLAQSAQAGPIGWIKQQFKEHPTRTALIVGVGAATVHGLALRHCREGSVEHCQSGYGAAWASFGIASGVNLAIVSSTKSCWGDHSAAFCSLFAYGGSATQAGFAVSQWRNKAPAIESTGIGH